MDQGYYLMTHRSDYSNLVGLQYLAARRFVSDGRDAREHVGGAGRARCGVRPVVRRLANVACRIFDSDAVCVLKGGNVALPRNSLITATAGFAVERRHRQGPKNGGVLKERVVVWFGGEVGKVGYRTLDDLPGVRPRSMRLGVCGRRDADGERSRAPPPGAPRVIECCSDVV